MLSDDRKKLLVLKTFLNRTSDSVFITDEKGITLDANRKFEELYGWTREEVIGTMMPMTLESLALASASSERSELRDSIDLQGLKRHRKDGRTVLVDVAVAPVRDDEGAVFAYVIIETDVTGQRRAEEKLKESEERYRILIDTLPEPIVVYQDNMLVFANPAAYQSMGAEHPSQLLGLDISSFVDAEDLERIVADEIDPIKQPSTDNVIRIVRFDGTVIQVEFSAAQIEYEGKPAMQFLCRDITEQKNAADKLAAKERELSRILKLSPEPIVLTQSGVITFLNDRAIQLLRGTCASQFVGRHILSIFSESQHQILEDRMRRVVESEEYMEFIELKLLPLEGEAIDVEAASICVRKYLEQPVVQIVIRDLTDRKRAEEMIRRSEKLSIAGELAAGVAHEIRNPLTALRGFMQLLRARNTDYVDIMLMEIDRISFIVNEFIGMAKPQALRFVECDLKQLIESVMTFMQPQALLFNVQMELKVAGDMDKPLVECEPNQMKQVYMNVLKNAIESMPRGGKIEISIADDMDGYLLTRIVDQGVGIPEERLGKIGEPFFSLKESGTGLGLMVCNRIVEAHRGKLNIYSVVDKGTTIEIALPLRAIS
ncbi:PAS domain-containing sensor histidine kinase [Cohnella panacarvi]|uniref:PAS domain-containing sensor histidine kinase n=1 Tax=Cohnella panacarvi TaxID=400776 RepID=UPI00047E9B0A|nr:PAS domain-containing sensor histidine kinase [Cohnella panacarvi]